MFVVGVLYCVQLLSEVFFQSFLLPVSFAKVFFFYLAPFFLESKTKGSSKGWTAATQKNPRMTMIFNSMFVVWVLYCVQFFLKCVFFTKKYPFLCYSCCLLLSSILLASSPWFLWCFYESLIKFLSKFYVISMVFLWYSMVFLKMCLW